MLPARRMLPVVAVAGLVAVGGVSGQESASAEAAAAKEPRVERLEQGIGRIGQITETRRLWVRAADIEALWLPLKLDDLVDHIDQLVQLDQQLRVEVVRRLVRAFFAFEGARREVELLREQSGNLRAIWKLEDRLAANAEVPDIEVLRSRNAYLAAEIGVENAVGECRGHLWEIVEVCNIGVSTEVTNSGTDERAGAAGSVRERE